MKRELCLVQKELSDCREMEGWNDQCQLVLKAVAGMDFTELAKFLAHIAQKRFKTYSLKPVRNINTFFAGCCALTEEKLKRLINGTLVEIMLYLI